MTAHNASNPAPHFDHELERNLFAALVLLFTSPLIGLAVRATAFNSYVAPQFRTGLEIGLGVAFGLAGRIFVFAYPRVLRALDATLLRLGLSSWGLPTTALVLAADLTYRKLEAEFIVGMAHWLEWLTLGLLAVLGAWQALSARRG